MSSDSNPEHDGDWHFQHLLEFCRYERLTGGPDPHMKAIIAMCDGLPIVERVWLACLYVGFYNVPAAERAWREAWRDDEGTINEWMEMKWGALPLRRERRTVNTPTKMADYLRGYAMTMEALADLQDMRFEEAWKFAMHLPRVGRYAATKLIGIWPEIGVMSDDARMPDIRAKGGWSPRAALNLIYQRDQRDVRDDSPYEVQMAEDRALEIQHRLALHGCVVSTFDLEVMLCEYKASYSTRRQYPGRSLDSELKYELAARGTLDHGSQHMRVRRELSPEWALGEVQGWSGPREELGLMLSQYGYTWSDHLYDYRATVAAGDFKNPVRRVHPC